jgi:hypothetical protein
MQRGIFEVVGEQAEARDVGRPAPARGGEGEQRYLEYIAGFGAVDEYWAGNGIDLAEVQGRDIGDRRGLGELSAGGFVHIELDGLSRRYMQRRCQRVVPAGVALMFVNGVERRHGLNPRWAERCRGAASWPLVAR